MLATAQLWIFCLPEGLPNVVLLWVWNTVSHVKGKTQFEGVCEQGAEEDMVLKGLKARSLGKTA